MWACAAHKVTSTRPKKCHKFTPQQSSKPSTYLVWSSQCGGGSRKVNVVGRTVLMCTMRLCDGRLLGLFTPVFWWMLCFYCTDVNWMARTPLVNYVALSAAHVWCVSEDLRWAVLGPHRSLSSAIIHTAVAMLDLNMTTNRADVSVSFENDCMERAKSA